MSENKVVDVILHCQKQFKKDNLPEEKVLCFLCCCIFRELVNLLNFQWPTTVLLLSKKYAGEQFTWLPLTI